MLVEGKNYDYAMQLIVLSNLMRLTLQWCPIEFFLTVIKTTTALIYFSTAVAIELCSIFDCSFFRMLFSFSFCFVLRNIKRYYWSWFYHLPSERSASLSEVV